MTGRPTSYALPGGARYDVDDAARAVTTTFPDGSTLTGFASFTDEDEARARALGYSGDRERACWAMHRDHDLLHHVVAAAAGDGWSRVLHAVARGEAVAGEHEERMVFLLARALNAGGQTPDFLLD